MIKSFLFLVLLSFQIAAQPDDHLGCLFPMPYCWQRKLENQIKALVQKQTQAIVKQFQEKVKSIQASFQDAIILTQNKECPQGWEEWKQGSCRSIVIEGTATDENNQTKNCNLLQKKGAFSHKLTVAQLAPHQHAQGSRSVDRFYGGGFDSGKTTWFTGNDQPVYGGQNTASSGNGDPFNIRDPYVVLKACKKIK